MLLVGRRGTELLATYDSERRPIGSANTIEAAANYARNGDIFAGAAEAEAESPAGDAARFAIAVKLQPKFKPSRPLACI